MINAFICSLVNLPLECMASLAICLMLLGAALSVLGVVVGTVTAGVIAAVLAGVVPLWQPIKLVLVKLTAIVVMKNDAFMVSHSFNKRKLATALHRDEFNKVL